MSDPARYTIDIDPDRALVRITLSGFFRPEDYAGFAALRAERQALLGGRPHSTIADIRGLAILSQDMVTMFSNRLGTPPFRAERLAFVIAPSLTRLQLQRATATRETHCFTRLDDAERWMLGDTQAAAA
jgi:hypothetical protein